MTIAVIDLSQASSSPLNPLSAKARTFLLEQLQQARADNTVTAVILTGGRHFSSGADLTEFAALSLSSSEPSLLDVVDALDTSPKPVVAAITGTCLGGGLELALACHYRIATPSAQLGLPEVHVGVIPGAGGTQRLPRLIGLEKSLELILSGAAVSGKKALQLGLVDAVGQDCLSIAHKWADWARHLPVENRRLSLQTVPTDPATAHVMLEMAKLALPTAARGGEGRLAALEAVRASVTRDFAAGMRQEGRLFLDVLTSEQGQARRHAFFAERAAQKPIVTPLPASVQSSPLLQKDVAQVETAVIGAGTMGGGIALVLLQAGFTVWLVDVNPQALAKGLAALSATVEDKVKRRRLSADQAASMMSRLRSTQDLLDLGNCQLVVEAVIENLPVKQKIFTTLAQVTPPSAILLSNTSTLDIDQMATALNVTESPLLQRQRRAQFAGWHFFSPASVMKLVEIVVGRDTAPSTVALLQALSKRIRKIAVVVGNCDGFCGNRLLKPYQAETVALLTQGASIEQIDQALLDFGMALGPFQLSDLAGNDVGYNIRKERGWVRLHKNDPIPPQRPARYTELADDMVAELGRNGQKAGRGWYDYDPSIGKGRKGLPSAEMAAYIQNYVTDTKTFTTQEILERVLYPLVNEGCKCLEESIARSPGDIDIVYLYGYGFPAWRGGPMYWADHQVGLPRLLSTLERLSHEFPETEHYRPSPLLQECVAAGLTVEDYYRQGLHQKNRSRL